MIFFLWSDDAALALLFTNTGTHSDLFLIYVWKKMRVLEALSFFI